MASRAQWINWFSTGKKPLGTQFADLITLVFKKDEDSLPIASVTNLQTALNNKADKAVVDAISSRTVTLEPGVLSWIVPAGTVIEKFIVLAPTAINLNIGTAEGGNDLVDDWGVVGMDVYVKDKAFVNQTTIYFTGTSGDTVIKIVRL